MINCFLTRIMQRRVLRRIDNPHQGKYVSFNASKRIGLITDAADPGTEDAVRIMRKETSRRNVDLAFICLDFRKEAVPGEQVIGRKDVNWYMLPHEDKTSAFLARPFDIIIDLTYGKKLFPAVFLIRSARATLLIGTEPCKDISYDITISRSSQTTTTAELVKSIIEYLTTIK